MSTLDSNTAEKVGLMENEQTDPAVSMATSIDPSLTESSTSSGWSMVDSYGDLLEDDTVSTSSSVEIVDEEDTDTPDDPMDDPNTPVGGCSPSGRQLFVLRLPSHSSVNYADTDEEHATPCPSRLTGRSTSISEQEAVAERLDSLTQTLEGLRQQLGDKVAAVPPVTTLGQAGEVTLGDEAEESTTLPGLAGKLTLSETHTEDISPDDNPVSNDSNQEMDREPGAMTIWRNASEVDTGASLTDRQDDTEDVLALSDTVPAVSHSGFREYRIIFLIMGCVLVGSMILNAFCIMRVPLFEIKMESPSTDNTERDFHGSHGSSSCRVRLNEALQEIRDLKAEVGRLKYTVPSVGEYESVLTMKEQLEAQLLRYDQETSAAKLRLEQKVNTTKARLADMTQERDEAVKQTTVLREDLDNLNVELSSARDKAKQCCDQDSSQSTGSTWDHRACWECINKVKVDFTEFDFSHMKEYMPTEMFDFFNQMVKNSRSFYEQKFSEKSDEGSGWQEHEEQQEKTAESHFTGWNTWRGSEDEKMHSGTFENGGMEADYWTNIMKMLNTTKHHLENTWTKVRSTSEDLVKKHQPKLQSLQENFMKKMRKLNDKIQHKMSKKMKKWFSDSNTPDDTDDRDVDESEDEFVRNAETVRRQHSYKSESKWPHHSDSGDRYGNRQEEHRLKYRRNQQFRDEDWFRDDSLFDVNDLDLDDDDDQDDGKVETEDEDRGENWYLERGGDREYYREEPDDWFFKRYHKKDQIKGDETECIRHKGEYLCK